jgi:galactonate dehydratase
MPLSLAADQTAMAQKANTHLTVADLHVFSIRVNHRGNWTIARLRTAGGVTGLGDASQSSHDDQTVLYLKQFSDLLRGRSIFDIEWFRQATRAVVAQHGQPVQPAPSSRLCGIFGERFFLCRRTHFSVAASRSGFACMPTSIARPRIAPRTASRVWRNAPSARASTPVKLAPFDEMPHGLTDEAQIEDFSRRGLACAEGVRKTIGDKRHLLIDVHSRFDLTHGLELTRRFEPLHLFWLEEITASDADLPAIHRAAKMPTAGGESYRGVKAFYPYIKAELVDIVMPELKVCGGMLELKKIAAMCEGAGLLTSPHGPASPVGNVCAAHVIATVPNFNILELSYGEVPWRAELIQPAEEIQQGALVLSDRPGLGITLNEKVAAQYAVS